MNSRELGVPYVNFIKLSFLKIITNSNVTYQNSFFFFLVSFIDEKKPSPHKVLKLIPQSIR